jgi:hypothetical protein
MIEHLFCKCKALSSNPSPTKINKQREIKQKGQGLSGSVLAPKLPKSDKNIITGKRTVHNDKRVSYSGRYTSYKYICT